MSNRSIGAYRLDSVFVDITVFVSLAYLCPLLAVLHDSVKVVNNETDTNNEDWDAYSQGNGRIATSFTPRAQHLGCHIADAVSVVLLGGVTPARLIVAL